MFGVMRLEIARNITRLGVYCLAGFLIVSMVILQLGLEKLKLDEKQSREFVDVQLERLVGFINYEQYGLAGIDRLLQASPLFYLFHHSSTLDELQANIEMSTRYKLYKPEMGKNLFKRPTGGSLDFSWFYLIFGTLSVSLWSFLISRGKDFNIFLNNYVGVKGIYTGIMLGRILLVMMANLIVLSVCLLLYLVNGIEPGPGEINGLLQLYVVSTIMMVILTAVTGWFGAAKNWKKGAIIAAISWIIIVFIWPEALNAVFARKAEISLKSLEAYQKEKNDLLLPFEKRALKNTGRFDSQPEKQESDRESAEKYWNEVSKKIRAIDLHMMEKIEKLSRSFHFWSIFNPVTFYKSVNNELGSKGYNSYNNFFKENLVIQRKFLRHVFDKRYYENYSKVEPFLPADELVVKAEPGLPGYYLAGIIFNFFLMVLSLFIGYFIFKKHLLAKPEVPGGYEEVDINANDGNIEFVSCEKPDLSYTVVNVTRGYARGFNGKITINNHDVVKEGGTDFDFILNQAEIPGNIRVKQLLHFMAKTAGIDKEKINTFKQKNQDKLKCRFCELEPVERAVILLDLCLLREAKIYILKDFSSGIFQHSLPQLIDKLEQLKEKNLLILCLSDMFMKPDKSYSYSYDRKQEKYVDIENYYVNSMSARKR
jgi:ABC-type Na+ transport system ATPase subunit NatA